MVICYKSNRKLTFLCMVGSLTNWALLTTGTMPLHSKSPQPKLKSNLFYPKFDIPTSLFSILITGITIYEHDFQASYSSAKPNIHFLMFFHLCPFRSFYHLCSSCISLLKQHLIWDTFLIVEMKAYVLMLCVLLVSYT